MSSSSSSSLSFAPVAHQHCLNVPVLYELVRGEEKESRIWLRSEMYQIADPLIDSLFHGLIMSSSSSAVAQSRSTVPELCQLLEGEKVEVSRVLKEEMNRLVNTLFERLNNKLRTNSELYRLEGGGDRAQVVVPFDQVESPNSQSHQPSSLIAQPSTFGLYYHQQHSNGDELELNTVEMIEIKKEVEDGEETRLIDIETLTEDYQGGAGESRTRNTTQQMDCVKQEIKEEFDCEQEIDIETLTQDHQGGIARSMESAKIETTRRVNYAELEVKDEFGYEHEIVIKQEEEDETTNKEVKLEIKEEVEEELEDGVNECSVNDIDEFVEDSQGGDDESRSVENAPMDITPSQPIGQFQLNRQCGRIEKRKQTDGEPQPQVQNEVNNEKDVEEGEDDYGDGDGDGEEVIARPVKRPRPAVLPSTSSSAQEKRIITLSLRCPLMCVELIAKHDFNDHMMEKHSIGQFRCVVKDCAQSFDKQYLLTLHLSQSHPHTTQWHCDTCEKHSSTYRKLSSHNIDYHQLGNFQCSFPECTFTGEYRKKVYDHYHYQHHLKVKPDLVCPQSGCDYRTKNPTYFKAHERSHLGKKPYHCKWPDCHYSHSSRNATMMHIKQSHLKSKTGPSLGKPNDYLEFVP